MRTVGVQLVLKKLNDLVLKPCNPGFCARGLKCDCCSTKYDGMSRCEKNGIGFYMEKGYWAGKVGSTFVTYECPNNYCKYPNTSSNEYLVENFEKHQFCRKNRNQTGILCGKCEHGYSVLLGNEACGKDCSNLYILLFILYAIIVFGIVMLVMLINLDVFTGYLNAWLYSYQVIGHLLPPGFQLDPFINFIIGLANIQIKAGGSCLLSDLGDADKLAMLYVLPTYILLVVYLRATELVLQPPRQGTVPCLLHAVRPLLHRHHEHLLEDPPPRRAARDEQNRPVQRRRRRVLPRQAHWLRHPGDRVRSVGGDSFPADADVYSVLYAMSAACPESQQPPGRVRLVPELLQGEFPLVFGVLLCGSSAALGHLHVHALWLLEAHSARGALRPCLDHVRVLPAL